MLCSDGLTRDVPDASIVAALHATPSPAEAAEVLVDMAKRAGGSDNITIIVAEFGRLQRARASGRDPRGRQTSARVKHLGWGLAAVLLLAAVLAGTLYHQATSAPNATSARQGR